MEAAREDIQVMLAPVYLAYVKSSPLINACAPMMSVSTQSLKLPRPPALAFEIKISRPLRCSLAQSTKALVCSELLRSQE